jgi:hypothetical protein
MPFTVTTILTYYLGAENEKKISRLQEIKRLGGRLDEEAVVIIYMFS